MRLVYAAVGRLYHPSVPSSLQLPRSSSRSSCTSIIAATSSFIVSFLVYFHHRCNFLVHRLVPRVLPSSLQLPRSSSRSSCTSIIAATSSFIVSFLVYFHHRCNFLVHRLVPRVLPSWLQLPRSSSRSSCTSIIAATSSFLVYFHHGYTTLTTVICQFFTSILALFALSSRQRVPLMSLHWRHEHQQNT